jgi:Putative peptidoglycan binding domain/Transglycosylase SLT domain
MKSVLEFLKDLLLFIAGGVLVGTFISYCAPAHAEQIDSAALRAYAVERQAAYNIPDNLAIAIIDYENRGPVWHNVAGAHGEIGVAQIQPATVAMICPSCVGNVHHKVFALGSRGDDVARIQAVLAREGFYEAAVDGLYGPITDRAVRLYQHVHKIASDGLVGARTWRELFGPYDPFPGKTIAQELWNPQQNIEWAMRYIAWLRDNVSADPMIIAASYNGGPGNPVVRYMLGVQKRLATSVRPVSFKVGAGAPTRTADLLITNQWLYRFRSTCCDFRKTARPSPTAFQAVSVVIFATANSGGQRSVCDQHP